MAGFLKAERRSAVSKGLRIVAIAGLLAGTVSTVSAQSVGNYKFLNGSNVAAFGYSVGTYKAQLDGRLLDVYCVDFLNHIARGNQFKVYITSLAGPAPDLGKTRFGSYAGQLDRYKQAAWLATQFKPTNTSQWGSIQGAIWHLTTPFAPRLTAAQNVLVNDWMDRAARNFSRFYYNNVSLLTDTALDRCRAANPGSAPWNGCGRQEHIFIDGGALTVTPEPGSVALLATGLVAISGIGAIRRRRTKALE